MSSTEALSSENPQLFYRYSEKQSWILVNTPRVSGALSILGSATIIFIVLHDWQRKRRRVYHRILLIYSIVDVIVSFNYCLSSLVVPIEAVGYDSVYGASGNAATCNASGFVLQFFMTQGTYATFICVYYALVLRYRVREETIAHRIEPWVHLFAFLAPLVIGSISLHRDLFVPAEIMAGWCSRVYFPPVVIDENATTTSQQEDELKYKTLGSGSSSQTALTLNWIVSILFVAFFLIVLLSSIVTYLKVREVQLRGARWAASRRLSEIRVRDAGIQAFLYVATFQFTYCYGLFVLLGPSPVTDHVRYYFAVAVFGKIALPLQGFWNFFIYVRPRFRALRRRNGSMPLRVVMKKILYSQESDTRHHETTQATGGSRPNRRLSILGSLGVSAAMLQPPSKAQAAPAALSSLQNGNNPIVVGSSGNRNAMREQEEDEFLPELGGMEFTVHAVPAPDQNDATNTKDDDNVSSCEQRDDTSGTEAIDFK